MMLMLNLKITLLAFIFPPAYLPCFSFVVCAGGYHTTFVDCFDQLWTCGANPFGQLGTGDRQSRQVPQLVASGVLLVAAGYAFTSFVSRTTGRVFSCGFAKNGRCGVRDCDIRMRTEDGFPMLLDFVEATSFRRLPRIQQIVCGSGHMLVLSNNQVYSIGRNDCGQCGVEERASEIAREFHVGVESPPDACVPRLVTGVPCGKKVKIFAGAYTR
jgi:alpha-tubulin suppressor-like RCC1 family protein